MSEQTKIHIKDPDVFCTLMENIFHYKLIDLVRMVVKVLLDMGITPVITSAFRLGDSGVHGCGRGIDFRSRNMTSQQIEQLCNTVNSKWKYDPKRPKKVCVLFHDVGQGPHLHIQVHPNTILVNERQV